MKFLLIILITWFCSVVSIGQSNGIGASYSLRIFPLQHFLNSDNQYFYSQYTSYDSYTIKVSNAFEHVTKVYYEFPSKTKNQQYTLGVNVYSAKLDFTVNTSSSYGNADVQGGWSTFNEDSRSGTYNYSFIGIDFGRLKHIPISEKFSFNLGYTTSINFLVSEKTTNKKNTSTNTYSEHSYDGSFSYSKTTTTTTDDVADLNNLLFNIKFELPFGFAFQSNNNKFQILSPLGLSTQSRLLVNPHGLNVYFSPQFSYTRLLQKRVKPIKA